jgi:carbamoyltransferase
MEVFLGINFDSHDTAVFAIDSKHDTPFAISMERITRFKHDTLFPVDCLDKYIQYRNIDVQEVTKVICGNSKLGQKSQRYRENHYEFEMLRREVLGEPYLKGYLTALKKFQKQNGFQKTIHLLLKGKYRQFNNLEKSSATNFQYNILKELLQKKFPKATISLTYFDHEECHAVSSYVTSPFDDNVLLITMDGHGDHNHFSKAFLVKNGEYKLLSQSTSPDKFIYYTGKHSSFWEECSIGGMYTYFTMQLGFTPHADEGKVEALAAYGSHDNVVYKKLWKCFAVKYNSENYPYIQVDKEEAEMLFSLDEFKKMKQDFKKEDLCAAMQKFLEEIMLEYIKGLIKQSGASKLCLSGGVFANVILNLRIFGELTPEVYIIPAMADDGSAEGACYMSYLHSGKKLADLKWMKAQTMPYWGTSYTTEEVEKAIQKFANKITIQPYNPNWPEHAALLVSERKIGALFHGRMEWGPRALGNRSIIADTRFSDVTEKINLSIKKRPLFQPFCPSILEEERERLFESSYSNKHMTAAFYLKPEFRDKIPASAHIDGTARAQFVSDNENPMFYRYLKEMKALTGFGVSINTSFNKHGRTIVETPEDAVVDFLDTNLDFLYIEGILITRK